MVKKPTKPRRTEDRPFPRSTMETIDKALHTFVSETLDINCVTTTGFRKVPVIWSSAERMYQSKSDQRIRDKEGALVMPLITVERTGIVKDPSRKGTVFANIPPIDKVKGGSISVSRKVNQGKTSNFENAQSKRKRGQLNFPGAAGKTVYETLTIPLPVYVTIKYEITLRSEYQEQMNQMLTPFITRPGGINYVIIEEGRLRYEAFVQEDFAQNNNIRNFSNEERKFETKVTIEVLGWLTSQDKNSLQPDFAVREGVVEVKIPRERVALADELDTANGRLYGLAGIKPDARFRKAVDADDPISTFGPVSVPGLPAAASTSGTETGTRGPEGPTGPTGPTGAAGADGADGTSVSNVQINGSNELVITLSDGQVFNLGNVKGDTGDTGATPDLDVISGTLATYHTFDSEKAVFHDLDVSGTSLFTGDVTFLGNLIGGSPLKVSQSLAIIDGDGDTVALFGSSSLGPSIFSASLITTDEISVTNDIKFTGLSAASAVATRFLALDSSNNVVLTSSSPVINLVVTGSDAQYHSISGSTATFNLVDADRGQINDIDFTSLSGSSGTIHTLSASTVTSNLIDTDRISTSQVVATKLSGSLTTLSDGTDYLIAGTNITLATSSAGAVTISSAGAVADVDIISGSSATYHNMSASVLTSNLLDTDRLETRDITGTGEVTLSGLSSGTGVSTKYLALDSSDNIVLTSSSGTGGGGGGDGTIGAAEDGSYTDGLFTDFTSNTLIGVPIDRFNEVLKILAPSPAPDLRSIEDNISNGVTAKLSFGSSQTVPHYSSSATAAGFTAVDINESYSPTNSGRNLRIGIYDGSQDVTGLLNDNVAASITNTYVAYASGAFGNAETGTLKLELNGNIIHSINLSEFNGAGNPGSGTDSSLNSDTSGFTNTSLTASSFDGNNAEWNIFKHRTSRFKIDTNSMVPGWNYARVIHTVGATDKETNFIEWVNDPSGSVNNLAASKERIEDIVLVGSKFLSGVEYNTDATANYKVDVSNLYQNVYQDSGTPISFTVSNSTTPSAQSVPSIDTAAGEDSTKVLSVTASLDVNTNSLVNGAVTANVTATHPLKSTLSNGGSATTGNGFLIDNRTLASSNLIERFHDETYRKASGSYETQASITLGSNEWNSRNHMTSSGASGHEEGLLYFNQRLYSPIDGDVPNGGNFDGLINVENEQPDYSAVSGLRTFFRVLSNSSGVTKRDIKIVTTKNSTTFNNSALSTANAHLYVKIPGQTGWMDASQNFVYGRIDTDDGALISGASNDVDSGNNTHHLTFGTASVANGDHVVIKVEADATWAGYLSQFNFTLGATTNTAIESLALDDIDVNDTGLSDARLSFGASHTIPNYSSATGSSIGLTNFDTNGNYTVSGDRRGVFSSLTVINGELNEDVSSNGNNYPANSFKDALNGSLVLEVNGSEIHTVDVSSTVEAISNDFNGNSSGFSVSSVDWSTTTDNIPDYTKPYRTGTYQIGTAEQRLGWNYARVIHRTDGGDVNTNYVEWVNDTDSSALTSSFSDMSKFDHTDLFYQSGVGYFASRPTASYTYEASNVYRNVYQQGTAVTFPTTTNCSVTNIRISGSGVTTSNAAASSTSLASLNNIGNCHIKDVQVTGTVRFDSLTSIVEEFGVHTSYNTSVTSRVIHPHKSTLNIRSLTRSNLMVFSGSLGSTNLNTNEYFNIEEYRIVSGTYNNQADPIADGNKWNSSLSVNDNVSYPTHADGLAFVNGYLVSPKKLGNSGDTRNVADGGTLQAPADNPNYTTLTLATRTFERYFQNNTSNDRSSITITLYGSGSLVKRATAIGPNGNLYLDAKIPGKTAWLDVGTAYASNNPNTDGAGALDGADPGNPAVDISPGGTTVVCNFNGQSLLGTGGGSEYVVLRITADEDWLGYLTRLQVAYS